jgi:putative flippase GtrA
MTATSLLAPIATHRETFRQLATFGVIGVASTLAYVGLYAWLRGSAPAGVANALALLITAVANTAANRWLTFRVRGREGLARDHAAGLVAFGAALAITSAALVLLNAIAPHHGRLTEVAVLIAANAVATLVRFLLLRLFVERNREAETPAGPPAAAMPDRAGAGSQSGAATPDRARPARVSRPAFVTLSKSERTRG